MKFKRLLLLMIFPLAANAMQKEETKLELKHMPKEIKALIIQAIAQADSIQQAIKSLRALAVTSKEYNRLVNNPTVTKEILNQLVKKFPQETNNDFTFAAVVLNTQGAKLWLASIYPNLEWFKKFTSFGFFIKTLLENPQLIKTILLNEQLAHYYATTQLSPIGTTALMAAVNKEDLDIVETLLNAGADPNIQNIEGFTPLMIAILRDKTDIAKAIINSKSVNLTLRHRSGNTALDMARQRGQKEIIDLINQKLNPDKERKLFRIRF